jgi:membrane associated rhomboid family serine protease
MFIPYHDDNPTTRFPLVTGALIAINVLSFVWLNRLDPLEREVVWAQRGFVPKRIEQLHDPKLVVRVPLSTAVGVDPRTGRVLEVRRWQDLPSEPRQVYLSLLTAMFLHGGWLHLIGNMWFLWLFGNNIEDRIGHALFLLFYLAGGMAAWLAHWAVLPEDAATRPVIGASGAVAAVLGGYAVTYPTANVRCLVFIVIFVTVIHLPALAVLAIWFATQVISAMVEMRAVGVTGGVAWWAHIGGFAAGAALMPLLSAIVPNRRSRREYV